MKERSFFLAGVAFVTVLGFYEKAESKAPLSAQDLAARCMAIVPIEWSEYEGASSFGVAFKDNSGITVETAAVKVGYLHEALDRCIRSGTPISDGD